jgi:hypothetical protein
MDEARKLRSNEAKMQREESELPQREQRAAEDTEKRRKFVALDRKTHPSHEPRSMGHSQDRLMGGVGWKIQEHGLFAAQSEQECLCHMRLA